MVSVIIPNYNHAAYLKKRIDSVLNQTYRDFELIILDDASTDNSHKIIEQYRDNPKVSGILFNAKNSGSTFQQWEKGIALAKGDYIWIAESDDYAEEGFIQAAITQLKVNNSDIHYCESRVVNEQDLVIEHTLQWPKAVTTINWDKPFAMKGREFIRIALQYRNVIPNASAVIFRKMAFDFTGLKKYKSAGDWLFWIRILLQADISFSPDILNNFRSHSHTTRAVTGHQQILLRYFEELAIRYILHAKMLVGDKNELTRFLNATIAISLLTDFWYFFVLCRKFNLPLEYSLKFIFKKLSYK